MRFEIVHRTDYRYSEPVIEAYLEARMKAPDTDGQRVLKRNFTINPELATSEYTDFWGNSVEFFSLTLRHERLSIENRILVETMHHTVPPEALDVSIAEARQLFSSVLIDYFSYLQPTDAVPTGRRAVPWARRHLAPGRPIRDGLQSLNEALYRFFEYVPGVTTNTTPLETIWRQRQGVCQDYAHAMLSVLRTAGLPCRYVCGYIETEAPGGSGGRTSTVRLVGSAATHAWVEVLLPGLVWVGLDPTNNRWCSEQHVAVSYGRDSRDAAPVRGTFKGAGKQDMRVKVNMRRLAQKP